MTILRALGLKPVSVETHEVAKPLRIGIPGILDEGSQPARQCFGQTLLTWCVERTRQEQGAGIVIDTITVGAIGHRMDCMLEKAGVVTHRQKVSDLHFGRRLAAGGSDALIKPRNRPRAMPSSAFKSGDVTLCRSFPCH